MKAFRRTYFFGFAAIAFAVVRDGPAAALDRVGYVIERIAVAIRDFCALAWALLAPSPIALNADGWSMAVPMGDALDPALLHSMRHEAGQKRRAAARHT